MVFPLACVSLPFTLRRHKNRQHANTRASTQTHTYVHVDAHAAKIIHTYILTFVHPYLHKYTYSVFVPSVFFYLQLSYPANTVCYQSEKVVEWLGCIHNVVTASVTKSWAKISTVVP